MSSEHAELVDTNYMVGEIDEPEVREKFRSPVFLFVPTIIGFAGYSISVIVFIFAGLIMTFQSLQAQFTNWAVLSLILSIIFYFVSKYVVNTFGFKRLLMKENRFRVLTPFGKDYSVYKKDIIGIDLQKPTRFRFLQKNTTIITFVTHERTYKLRSSLFKNSEELLMFFEEISSHMEDEYFNIFQRVHDNKFSVWSRVRNDPLGIVAFVIFMGYLIMAIWGSITLLIYPLSPYFRFGFFMDNPEFPHYRSDDLEYNEAIFHPPSWRFPMGTDYLSRDVFARMIVGTTNSFIVAVAATAILMILIIVFGYTAALYEGSVWDNIVTRLADTLITFPPFIPILLISVLAQPVRASFEVAYFLVVFCGLALLTWPGGFRLIRAETIQLLQQDYVDAVDLLGGNKFYLLIKHIMPKTFSTLMMILAYAFSDVIIGVTLIGFLGLGGENSLIWGSDLFNAILFGEQYVVDLRLDILDIWWTYTYPTLFIFFIIFALNILADTVRDDYQRLAIGLPTKSAQGGTVA